MRFLLPQLMWTGISISIYTGMLTPIIYKTMPDTYTDNKKFEDSMFAMISLGVGEVIGGILMGILVDRIGSKKCCLINVCNIAFTVMITAIYIHKDNYNGLAFFMTFLWGF